MNCKGHRGRLGQALVMALFAASVLFSASVAAANASPASPVAGVAHELSSAPVDAPHPEGVPMPGSGCASHAPCSAAVAMLAPAGRAIHARAIAALAPLVLLLPGGLSAAPHAKPPIV